MSPCWTSLSYCSVLLLALAPLEAKDVVLLLETSPGMQPYIAATAAPALAAGDRMAVMGFGKKTRVRQEFTDDHAALAKAVRRLGGRFLQIGSVWHSMQPDARVYAAIAKACAMLPKGGAVVMLFGSEDAGSGGTLDVRKCLERGVKLDVSGLRRHGAQNVPSRQTQTPPTLPGRYPVDTDLYPTPMETLKALHDLGAVTDAAGWDLGKALDRVTR